MVHIPHSEEKLKALSIADLTALERYANQMLTNSPTSRAGDETTQPYWARVQNVCIDALSERIDAIFPTESA